MRPKLKNQLKLHLDEKTVKLFVELLKAQRAGFKMQISNYTTKITSNHYNVTFLKTLQSNMVFAAAAKLKKDLSGKPVPDIDMKKNCYYDTQFKGSGFYSDIAFNIDIKHAYATILYRDGLITKETYNYLSRLPKLDRLAAVGMLASKKVIFEHDRAGAIRHFEEQTNPLSNFFFYCVQRTEGIIQDVKNKILKESFLFSWVDGMYYLNDNESYRIITQEYLRDEYGLESTFKVLHNFDVKLKNNSYRIEFNEEDKSDLLKKTFNIPLPELNYKREICDYLLTKKYQKK